MVFLSFFSSFFSNISASSHEGQHSFQNLTENQNLFFLKFVFLVSNCNVTVRIVPGLPGSKIEGHFYHKIEMTAPGKQQIPRTHCYNVLTYLSFLTDLLYVELCFSVVHKAHPVKVRKGRAAGGKWLPREPLWAWPWAVAPVCRIICLHFCVLCTPGSLWVLPITHPGSLMRHLTCVASDLIKL